MLLNSDAFLINQDTIELMRNRVFELLEKRGVKMSHPEVTKLLAKAGAKVGPSEIRNLGFFVKALSNAVANKVSDHRKAVFFYPGLYCVGYIGKSVPGLSLFNAFVEGFFGNAQQILRLDVDFPHRHRNGCVSEKIVQLNP